MCTPKNKLNRSCSESDLYNVNFDNLTVQDYSSVDFIEKVPLVKKRILYVEEIIHHNSPGLLRSGSCSQVFGQNVPEHLYNLQSFFSTSLVLNTNVNECDKLKLNLNTQLNPNLPMVSRNYMKNAGAIPMEVDILNSSIELDDCVDSVEMMDIDIDTDNVTRGRLNSFNNANSVMKKRYSSHKQADVTYSQKSIAHTNNTKIVPITLLKKQSQQSRCILLSLVCFIIILLYILFIKGYINIMAVNSDIQLQNIQKELLEKVYQQKASVNIVIQSLEQREHWAHKIKVLGFIGSAGVGKTFVTNIIKKHFPQELIHELYDIQLRYKSEWEKILTTLRNCCFNLIIIDDLNRKDITEVFALVHSLPQDQFILVISIFNIQYYDGKNYTINSNDITEIREEFENSGLYHELVVFQEFNINEVKDWIKQQLKFKNIDYNIQEEILKTVLEGYIVKYRGLKGLNSKILLELEKYR